MKLIIGAILLLFSGAVYASIRRSESPVNGELPDQAPDQAPVQLPEETFAEKVGFMDGKRTRGERNNNPGNIRKSTAPWKGKTAGADSAFETFETAQDGIRALARLLKTYQTRYGLQTVADIINKYAPANENNTRAYINSVAADLDVGPNEKIELSNPVTMGKMVAAIIKHENGRNSYSVAAIGAAVLLA